MRVCELMRRHVVSVAPHDSLSLAAQTMLWTGFRHLAVLAGGTLVGVLSERDILRHRAERDCAEPLQTPVSEAMSAPPLFAYMDEAIEVAAERMMANRISCLPVMQRGELVGIITTTDLLRAHVSALMRPPLGEAPTWCAGDVMTPAPKTIMEDDYLIEAVAKMANANVRHLPVVDRAGRLVGIISDRDVRLRAENLRHGVPMLRDERLRVRAAMCPDVISVHPEAPASVLLTAFRDWRLGALPVVDAEERLVGIVSYVDALAELSGEGCVSAPDDGLLA